MKVMTCPLNGPRNIQEFVCFGEVGEMPEPNETSDIDWAEYIWICPTTPPAWCASGGAMGRPTFGSSPSATR